MRVACPKCNKEMVIVAIDYNGKSYDPEQKKEILRKNPDLIIGKDYFEIQHCYGCKITLQYELRKEMKDVHKDTKKD